MTTNSRMEEARLKAALRLQHLCWDASREDRTTFLNRDRAMDVIDAVVVVVLETLQSYLDEEKKNAAQHSKQ
ncbi:MAG: hypothetical protein EBT15_07030 [Betaproteobacteria bacterium]|nr:hypothetical protein [Betaproteobacteria bacterium]